MCSGIFSPPKQPDIPAPLPPEEAAELMRPEVDKLKDRKRVSRSRLQIDYGAGEKKNSKSGLGIN